MIWLLLQYLCAAIFCGLLTLAVWIYIKPSFLIAIWKRFVVFKSRFHSNFLHLDDNTYCSYIERGSAAQDKQTILFIHGYQGSFVDFLCVDSYFDENKYHLVVIDMLNHGYSTIINRPVQLEEMMAFLRKVIVKLELSSDKLHLVGYSMGGFFSSYYTSLYPNNIASLVLLAPGSMKYFVKHDLFEQGDDLCLTINSNSEMQQFMDILGNGRIPNIPSVFLTALRYHKNEYSNIHAQVARGLRDKTEITSIDLLKKIKEFDCTLIWGDNDQIVDCRAAVPVKEHLPKCKFHSIKDGSHGLLITDIKETMKFMMQHFEKY